MCIGLVKQSVQSLFRSISVLFLIQVKYSSSNLSLEIPLVYFRQIFMGVLAQSTTVGGVLYTAISVFFDTFLYSNNMAVGKWRMIPAKILLRTISEISLNYEQLYFYILQNPIYWTVLLNI